MRTSIAVFGAICLSLGVGCGGAGEIAASADVDEAVASEEAALETTTYCGTSVATVAASATVNKSTGKISFGTTQGFTYNSGSAAKITNAGTSPHLFALVASSEGGEVFVNAAGASGSAQGTAYLCTYNVGSTGKLTLASQKAQSLVARNATSAAIKAKQVLLFVVKPVAVPSIYVSLASFVGNCESAKTWAANKLNSGSTSITVNAGYATGLASSGGTGFTEAASYLSSTYTYDAADTALDDTLVASNLNSGTAGRVVFCEYARSSTKATWAAMTASDLVLAARVAGTLDAVDSGGADVVSWLSAGTPAGGGSERVMLTMFAKTSLTAPSFTAEASLGR